MIDSWRGVCWPDDCDHLGHMNVGRYVGICGDGVFALQSALGVDPDTAFVAVRMESTFLSKVRPGTVLLLKSGVLKVGGKSATFLHELFAGPKQVPVFRAGLQSALMNLKTRRATEITGELRKRMEAAVEPAGTGDRI